MFQITDRKHFRNKNELVVPVDKSDAVSVASGDEVDEVDVDYRKKIKYGNRFQVKLFTCDIREFLFAMN